MSTIGDQSAQEIRDGSVVTMATAYSSAGSVANPTYHDFGVRVPPGADYVTESGQRIKNRSDRVMEFAPNPGSWEREQMLRRAQNVILDAANARIAALEVRLHGANERTQIVLKHYKSVLAERDEARARIAALEADNADLATLLAAERDRVSDDTPAHEVVVQDDFETRANAALHGKMAATVHELVLVSETLRSLLGESLSRVTPQAEQVGRLMCRIGQLEREAAAMNHPSFADRAEAELVERAMPTNALRHSR